MSKAQEFIRIKKRKKAIKRLIITTIICIVAIIIFIYKAPIFNVNKIAFKGMKAVNEKELQTMVKDYIGQNIFTLNYKEMKEKILEDPYIKEVTISKKGITTLNILIEEGKVAYYIQDGESYKAITNDGLYVEKLSTLEGRNLVNVTGAKDNGKEIGQIIIDDEKVIKALKEFNPIIKSNLSELRIEKIDVSNILNIKGYIKGVEIRFGSADNLIEKINKVLNILEQNKMEKGYIDVSFDGSPVVKVES